MIVGRGATVTVKLVELVAVPLGVITRIAPVVAPEGTVAVIWVAEFTVKLAETLLKVTELVVNPVPLKFVPVIVTEVPTGPEAGVKLVIVGDGPVPTVKLVALVAVAGPNAVVTWIGPVVAVALVVQPPSFHRWILT